MSYRGTRPPLTTRLHVLGYRLADGTEVTMKDKLVWNGEIRVRASDDYDDLYKLHRNGSFLWASAGDFGGNEDEEVEDEARPPKKRTRVNPNNFLEDEVPSVYAVFAAIPATSAGLLIGICANPVDASAIDDRLFAVGITSSVRKIAIYEVEDAEMIPGRFTFSDWETLPGEEVVV